MAFNIDDLTIEQMQVLNEGALAFGMKGSDYSMQVFFPLLILLRLMHC